MSRSTALSELASTRKLSEERTEDCLENVLECNTSVSVPEVPPSTGPVRAPGPTRTGTRANRLASNAIGEKRADCWRRLPRLGPGARACVVCGNMHAGTYGAGRYCSRSCSHRASAMVKWGRVSRDELLHATEALGSRCPKPSASIEVSPPRSSPQRCRRRRRRRHGCRRSTEASRPAATQTATPSPAAMRSPRTLQHAYAAPIACRLQIWVECLQSWKQVCIRAYDMDRDLHLVCLRGSSDLDGHGVCCHWISLRKTRVQFPPLEPPSPDMIERLLRESPDPV
ncbi:hypothetical protein CCYA_CCYA15G3986 [Cyanidiococcus yangmingshanensis]|nr:hypothetical protein CCYA_CCYA15G3986 [Cyanidiococcus yangmingshanensis]